MLPDWRHEFAIALAGCDFNGENKFTILAHLAAGWGVHPAYSCLQVSFADSIQKVKLWPGWRDKAYFAEPCRKFGQRSPIMLPLCRDCMVTLHFVLPANYAACTVNGKSKSKIACKFLQYRIMQEYEFALNVFSDNLQEWYAQAVPPLFSTYDSPENPAAKELEQWLNGQAENGLVLIPLRRERRKQISRNRWCELDSPRSQKKHAVLYAIVVDYFGYPADPLFCADKTEQEIAFARHIRNLQGWYKTVSIFFYEGLRIDDEYEEYVRSGCKVKPKPDKLPMYCLRSTTDTAFCMKYAEELAKYLKRANARIVIRYDMSRI